MTARPSASLPGFPPEARLLIVNADDFGLHPEVNEAVVHSIENGVAASCSLMTPCPAAAHAMTLLRDRPEIPFGVHLTLVCEQPGRPWGPLAPRALIPSLLDAAGGFPSFEEAPGVLAGARLDEIEIEFRAQLRAVLDAGLEPSHLDWHCLADGGRADVFELTLELADEHGLAVRAWLEPSRELLRARGLPALDHDFLDSFALDVTGRAEAYARALRELPPGLSEWAVHPGLGGPSSRAADPDGWRVRHGDHEFLTSPRARELIRQEGITVLGYGEIRRAWTERR
ncbi:polysaccharide deacetylase family protein [Nonomuraea sp. LP-02]|uniref:carbohydrate deacetylase n=1 Tax=Nonomuraea sp. LP-02 TaxID=3097960 RepID=UPI002E341616|nr:polysaccharide deacetylase family protein [Nonomuraea sp. LP-02]MED7923666.1 polysaccharide deacetylase family protein [Nonomuraea sp. LP-02]